MPRDPHPADAPALTTARVVRTWWPLAASWLFMSVELPVVGAFVARLPDAEIHLAAYGGIVFPIALVVEAPIIMLLAASTALCRDRATYRKLARFVWAAGAGLTALHLAVALTPLYDVVARGLIGAPKEIVGPARVGLVLMTPWTWAIADRRFNQGVLIRAGRSRAVGIGTAVRIGALVAALAAGYAYGRAPGIVVAATAVAVAVTAEAVFVRLVVGPVVREALPEVDPAVAPLTWHAFAAFYTPLVVTSLLLFLGHPVGSAALSRMPASLASLAVWPVLTGLLFVLRSGGMALNEVVVALLAEPEAGRALRRFAGALVVATSAAGLAVAATPLADLWFRRLSGLPPELADLAQQAVWLALPVAGLVVVQSWFQGVILHSRRTRAITEAVVVYLATYAGVLAAGVALGRWPGAAVGLAGLSIATFAQTAWLGWRSRGLRRALAVPAGAAAPPADGLAVP